MLNIIVNIVKILFLVSYFYVIPDIVYAEYGKMEVVAGTMLAIVVALAILIALSIKINIEYKMIGYYLFSNRCHKPLR